MHNIWFTSDQHFWHKNVIEYCKRPFSSVEEMNELMIQYYNELVKPEDTVYMLGDFSLAHRAVTTICPRLMGNKHLIAGNHDHCHPIHAKEKEERLQKARKLYYEAGFKSICLEDTRLIAGQIVHLHHMPYQSADATDERHQRWRPEDKGSWLLHGHVHEKWKQKGRMINVGVDVWNYRPVHIDEIAELIK